MHCFGKKQYRCIVIFICSFFQLIYTNAIHRNLPGGCLQAPLWCLTICKSALFYHCFHCTLPMWGLLGWIPLTKHYNMNDIYCTETKCGWLPCLVIIKVMKTVWPWLSCACLYFIRNGWVPLQGLGCLRTLVTAPQQAQGWTLVFVLHSIVPLCLYSGDACGTFTDADRQLGLNHPITSISDSDLTWLFLCFPKMSTVGKSNIV